MQISEPLSECWQGQREADGSLGVKCRQNVASRMGSNDKNSFGNELEIRERPNLSLQGDTDAHLAIVMQWVDCDAFLVHATHAFKDVNLGP
jgi:hypothetical protein